jgi:hypothetical protein
MSRTGILKQVGFNLSHPPTILPLQILVLLSISLINFGFNPLVLELPQLMANMSNVVLAATIAMGLMYDSSLVSVRYGSSVSGCGCTSRGRPT